VTGLPLGTNAEHPFEGCHVLFFTRAVRRAAAPVADQGIRFRRDAKCRRSRVLAGAICSRRADRNRQDRWIRPAMLQRLSMRPSPMHRCAQTGARIDPCPTASWPRKSTPLSDLRQTSENHVDALIGGVGSDPRPRNSGAASTFSSQRRVAARHHARGTSIFPRSRSSVLDEADRLLTWGFMPDVRPFSRCCRNSVRTCFLGHFPTRSRRLRKSC